MPDGTGTDPSSSLTEARIGVLADELNQLAMAVDSLATITPNSEDEYARTIRRRVREKTLKVRERISELIPE